MGDYQLLAGQLMILFQVGVGGLALWGACHLLAKITAKDPV